MPRALMEMRSCPKKSGFESIVERLAGTFDTGNRATTRFRSEVPLRYI